MRPSSQRLTGSLDGGVAEGGEPAMAVWPPKKKSLAAL
jgi:hypothetical protein